MSRLFPSHDARESVVIASVLWTIFASHGKAWWCLRIDLICTGAFVVGVTVPPVNVMSVSADTDYFWQPKVRVEAPAEFIWMDRTLMVYGLYSPYHFSHWLYNGILPVLR